ncbi:hypothetical protein [Vulcanisaeta distributa]|uniref:hypothetical protein n=1 Tax=Vulcanisaeta distributa TaxID=164451 RepID=UPI0006D263AD|nr:hypothetical protein [Vulcanisaeta distributa]
MITARGKVYPAPLNNVELNIKWLKSGEKTQIQGFNTYLFGFGGGITIRKTQQQQPLRVRRTISYQETTSAWIACIGRGYFIRLFDEEWDSSIVSDSDVKDRAFVINHFIKGVSRMRLGKKILIFILRVILGHG